MRGIWRWSQNGHEKVLRFGAAGAAEARDALVATAFLTALWPRPCSAVHTSVCRRASSSGTSLPQAHFTRTACLSARSEIGPGTAPGGTLVRHMGHARPSSEPVVSKCVARQSAQKL